MLLHAVLSLMLENIHCYIAIKHWVDQGLTLTVQARGTKRSFDIKYWSKTVFRLNIILLYIYSI